MTTPTRNSSDAQRIRLVYVGGVEEDDREGVADVVEVQPGRVRRSVVLTCIAGSLVLGALMVALLALASSDRTTKVAKQKRGPVFGYVLEEIQGPGLKR